MDVTDQEMLEECMSRMAAGDRASMFTFMQAFAPRLTPLVRRMLSEMGRRDVLDDPHEVEALVQDACWVICDRAPGWQPGRALPWTWAERAIRAEISRSVGHRTVQATDEHFPFVDAFDVTDAAREASVTFKTLAEEHPMVRLLAAAVAEIGNPRDQQVFIEYRLQKEMGDPSPSHVVARMFHLSPDNVRQIDRRMRVRLANIVATTPRFAPLEEVRWLAA